MRKLLALATMPTVSLSLFWLFSALNCAIVTCRDDGPRLPDSFAVFGAALIAIFQITVIFIPAALIRKRTDTIVAAAIPSILAAVLLVPVIFPLANDSFIHAALTVTVCFVPWYIGNLAGLTIWHRE